MKLQTMLIAGFGVLALVAMPGLTPCSISVPGPSGPNASSEASAALDWTVEHYLRASSWDDTVALAAAHAGYDTRGVWHDDWRLPTIEELQAAVTDNDPYTFGQTDSSVNYWSFWTSKGQGIWAYGVKVVSDANGDVIAAQSGAKLKHTKTSRLMAKFVRP